MQTPQNFEFVVSGTDGWATFRVDPQTLTVGSNEVKEANVFVAPLEDVEGVNTFTVKVMNNGNVVAEKTLSVDVDSSNGVETAKKVLAVNFF